MSDVKSILPPSFEWVEIPAGRVELEHGHGAFDVGSLGSRVVNNRSAPYMAVSWDFSPIYRSTEAQNPLQPREFLENLDVLAFMIAKYPLANAQFAKFIEAGGYREKQWWTTAG